MINVSSSIPLHGWAQARREQEAQQRDTKPQRPAAAPVAEPPKGTQWWYDRVKGETGTRDLGVLLIEIGVSDHFLIDTRERDRQTTSACHTKLRQGVSKYGLQPKNVCLWAIG